MKFHHLSFCLGLLALGASIGLQGQPRASEAGPSQPSPLAELKLVEQFDRNGDHLLDSAERQAARTYLLQHPATPPTMPTGRIAIQLPPAIALEPTKPGEKISLSEAPNFPAQPLYDSEIVRTLFLEFADADWEKQLSEFARTDVLVPARLSIDGKFHDGVGVHFHSPTSTPITGAGYKRSLDLTLDTSVTDQKIFGQRQLRLLDAASDPTVLRTMLYFHLARQYIPAPKANFVRVVINGEFWGVYVSVQPLDNNFIRENFKEDERAHWSVSAGGNFNYLGDNPDAYRGIYHLESAENPAAWAKLIALCKALKESTLNQLEAAIAAQLDIDSTLRFFALENTLINQGGYGSSTGGFGLTLTADGHLQLIPQEGESSFRLVESSEYGNRPQRPEPKTNNKSPDLGKKGKNGTPDGSAAKDPALKTNNPKDFPRQSGTDLAMILSYSFVNKADSDFNEKITKEEWFTFARSWFLVMDEDLIGKLTREQFLLKFRGVITPTSIADGRTKQTYGHDDPANIIGQDFFKAMDANQDNQLTSEELTNCFSQWFSKWRNPKTGVLTKTEIQRGFTELFSRTVFQADQTYIAKRPTALPDDERTPGPGGGKGKGLGGSFHLPTGGHNDARTLITFSSELDPLAGLEETNQPLLTKLLRVPVLRTRYLEYIREITENWLVWSKLGPIAKHYHQLIASEVSKETHRSSSYAHFVQELDQDPSPGSRDGDAAASLKEFATERSTYLLKDDRVMGVSDGP